MLILIAHGSRDSRWRSSVEYVTKSLQDRVGPDRARLAYMDCSPPTLMDVASDAVEAGAASIQVVPLFLTQQGHVDRDIRPMVDELRESFDSIEVALLPPVGQHPLFRELLGEIARQSGP